MTSYKAHELLWNRRHNNLHLALFTLIKCKLVYVWMMIRLVYKLGGIKQTNRYLKNAKISWLV